MTQSATPEQRDSSSLLDLVARPPEELHLRFEPISGITPALPGHVAAQPAAEVPAPQLQGMAAAHRARVSTPAPTGAFDAPRAQPPALPQQRGGEARVAAPHAPSRQTSGVQRSLGAEAPAVAAQAQRAQAYQVQRSPGVEAPRAAARQASEQSAAAPDARRAHARPRNNTPEAVAYARAREAVAARAAEAPRLTLREPAVEPAVRSSRARYWIYGVALGLGAAGLVAAGYSAALVQLTSRAAPAQSALPAPTATTVHTAVAHTHAEPPAAAPPSAPASAVETPSAAAEPPPPAASPAAPAKPGVKHAWRARSAPPEPSTAAPIIPEPGAAREAQPAEPREAPAEPSVPQPSQPPTSMDTPSDPGAPRLIITPLSEGAAPSAAVSGEAPVETENLPAQPGREEVQQILLNMRDKLASCVTGQHGTSYANVTINGTGRVGHTTIDGAFAGTPAGSCMARTLRSASFPRFSGPQLTVRYPYIF